MTLEHLENKVKTMWWLCVFVCLQLYPRIKPRQRSLAWSPGWDGSGGGRGGGRQEREKGGGRETVKRNKIKRGNFPICQDPAETNIFTCLNLHKNISTVQKLYKQPEQRCIDCQKKKDFRCSFKLQWCGNKSPFLFYRPINVRIFVWFSLPEEN